MAEKKQEKKPEDLTSDDLDKAVGGGVMVPERGARSAEQETKVTSKEESKKGA